MLKSYDKYWVQRRKQNKYSYFLNLRVYEQNINNKINNYYIYNHKVDKVQGAKRTYEIGVHFINILDD